MDFDNLGLCEPILRAAVQSGYETPTPIQDQAIPPILDGRDVLGCAQTGTGKTAAFAMPILHRLMAGNEKPKGKKKRRPIRVLVLSPTRELAAQIGQSFKTYGVNTSLRQSVIYGGVGQKTQTDALHRGVDVLVATPGRLLDLYNQGFVNFDSLETLVLDEADHMLDMGFLPDVRRIISKLPTRRQTLLFSATMPTDIRKLAESNLKKPVRIRIEPVVETAELIAQSIYFVEPSRKVELLARFLHFMPFGTALVFTRTKHGADGVVRKLGKLGVRSAAIHGNKSQTARQTTLSDFKEGRVMVLVATDIAARGLDISGISYVFNFDLPEVPETYVHRIGRTGRAGEVGMAVTLCSKEQRKLLTSIQRLLGKRLLQGPELPELPQGITPVTVDSTRKEQRTSGKPKGKRPTKRKGKGTFKGKRKPHAGATKAKATAKKKPMKTKRDSSKNKPKRKPVN
jgi:ATP-dependent RNA helicase RhlE